MAFDTAEMMVEGVTEAGADGCAHGCHCLPLLLAVGLPSLVMWRR